MAHVVVFFILVLSSVVKSSWIKQMEGRRIHSSNMKNKNVLFLDSFYGHIQLIVFSLLIDFPTSEE